MPSLHGVITVSTSFQRAYECEVECYEHATVIITSVELTIIMEGAIKEEPDSRWLARSFEPTEGVKEVLIDPSNSRDKVVCISAMISPK
jgi:hypothetical protein